MNDRLINIFNNFKKALNNLQIAVKEADSELTIDGTIKRFELTYELSWKLIKEYLANLGIVCKNPRDCFKNAFINNLIQDKDIWLKMIKDRNHLVHTYTFELSKEIFKNIKNNYINEFTYLYNTIKQGLENE